MAKVLDQKLTNLSNADSQFVFQNKRDEFFNILTTMAQFCLIA